MKWVQQRILIAVWISTLLLITVSAQAQDITVISPDLLEQLQEIESDTSSIRELDALEPVELNFPTRDALRIYLEELLTLSLDDETAAQAERFYIAFGFLEPDTDLRLLYLDLYAQQIGGFYDTETKEMNVILTSGEQPGDRLPLLEQIVYAHEFVHALQDQHFGLEALLAQAEAEDNGDRALATLALVEGDATIVMNTFTQQTIRGREFSALLELLVGGVRAGNLTLPPGTPDIIAQELTWPYFGGEQFIRQLWEEGGWEIVNAAYDNPPISTEQIYHPDRYLAGEGPVVVALGDASAALGTNWALSDTGVFGEFYLRQWLGAVLDGDTVNIAATGWGGDTYQIYSANDALAWRMHLVWDTDTDQTEFLDALQDYTAESETSTENNCYSRPVNGAILCWSESDHGVIVSKAPTVELARTLIEADL